MKILISSIFALVLISACSENPSEHFVQKSNKVNDTSYHDFFTNDKSKDAFSNPITELSHEEQDMFILGKSFFTIPWVEAPSATTARDGIGPLFSANTCKTCHPNNGAGLALDKHGKMSRSLLLRLSHKTSNKQNLLKTNGFEPDSTYGAQLSRNGNHNVPFEGIPTVQYEEVKGSYPDGQKFSLRKPTYGIESLNYGALDKETVVAPRIGSALIGLGLLERISSKDLLAHEDVEDKNQDGISGKANYAYSPELNKTILGRFTWKASATSVKHQSAGAAHNDMGLSNPLFPLHNCTNKQKACLEEAKKGEHTFDLPQKRLDAIAFYLSSLAVPKARKTKKHKEAQKLFTSLSCIKCHVSNYVTSDGITISPYSDLLLHDMGEDLADGRSEFLATGTEWRTAPLWGMGLYKKVSADANYLHDGRARSIEEAILWHDGEAKKSKEAFMQLDVTKRKKLLLFLETI